ncbi:unnamed protein product [Peronospora belbahrii]|uniref:peptidylprolyl isomerase n=1 Tax=Peronospora belbahrii TaxID=622444 RepID=A0ABN8CTX5_9STRA|nr:unnamed protein product [Peronospora belbahrii]
MSSNLKPDEQRVDFPRCVECGGYDSNKFCRDEGFIDISPRADGGVLKKIVREGKASIQKLEEGCPTIVHYVGRLMDGSIFDTTRDMLDGKYVGGTDDPFEFQLGREKVIKGWDIGVATMNVGEVARFIIAPEYGYGHKGFAPKVEPNETLDFEIELISFKDPLPRFPTQAELAESRKKQHEEDLKLLEENPPPTVDERIESALEQKEKGNALIAKQDYDQAQKCYDSGFVHIFYSKEEWENFLSQEDKDKVNKVKLLLYLNRALCKIKLAKIEDALWDCDQAILLDPNNSKGHFRRGLVFTEKLKNELEKEKNGEFWIVDKGFEYLSEAAKSFDKAKELIGDANDHKLLHALADLKRSQTLLNKYAAKYKEDEKKLYKEKIFDRLEAKNKELEKQEKLRAEAEEFDDMPALE